MACRRVVLLVHMAKTRHSGRMFERKTARKRPKRDRFRISATQTGNSARNSKHTMASPKYPFCSSRCSYGMPKCGPIGSYGQNQALWAHIWAENGPKTAWSCGWVSFSFFNHSLPVLSIFCQPGHRALIEGLKRTRSMSTNLLLHIHR